MRIVALGLLLALTSFAGGCSSDTEMTTEGYDQTCDRPEDCQVVFVGDVCGCPCEVDAIRTNEGSLWARERSNKQNRCDEVMDCAPCPNVSATCEANTCTAVTQQAEQE